MLGLDARALPSSGGRPTLYSDLVRDPEVDVLRRRVAELEARLGTNGGGENVPKNVPLASNGTVTGKEFDDWYAALPPEVQQWGGAKLRQKCAEDHGGRHVLKKATDHITRNRTPGRKPGSKNVQH